MKPDLAIPGQPMCANLFDLDEAGTQPPGKQESHTHKITL